MHKGAMAGGGTVALHKGVMAGGRYGALHRGAGKRAEPKSAGRGARWLPFRKKSVIISP